MSLAREKSLDSSHTVAAAIDPAPVRDSAAVKAAFRASAKGAHSRSGRRSSTSTPGSNKSVGGAGSRRMSFQSLSCLETFLATANTPKEEPRANVGDSRCGSIANFFASVSDSTKESKGNIMWSLHATEVYLDSHHKVLEQANAVLKDLFSNIPLDKLSGEVLKAFERLDTDSSGELDKAELRIAFDEFGLHLNPQEVAELIDVYDASHSGTLDRFEFEHMVRIMLAKPCEAACPA
eukprot:CAMPEP_0180240074 /NCGR_PEP_ID=MMETSP0987-20121128/31891_1 /TAXON_ID=697907 /ORGANISM="non described non described, Strain CCMP2293" /LENGTH=235 /DNA_ID=CAMNT_0022206887 /DNA_START=112 /DNA_END=815 /DNA_ORIENTATION=+